MKALHLKFLLFFILIFNCSCAQDYNWKKLQNGLYLAEIKQFKEKLVLENDTLNIEMYIFQPNSEIDLTKPINGRPTEYKSTFLNFSKSLGYKEFQLKKNSEYLVKKFNEKEIPNYSFELNNITENQMQEITDSVDKNFGIQLSEYMMSKNDSGENVVMSLTLQPNNKLDVEKIKKEFKNYITDIHILKPNALVYIYRIKS
jgi:hypothetical protein